jgi:hypothetical protein
MNFHKLPNSALRMRRAKTRTSNVRFGSGADNSATGQ